MTRYYYIHGMHGRVLTIAYDRSAEGLAQCGYAINKFCPNYQLQLDQRLKVLLGNEGFSALQKAFIQQFRGDPHNKKIARSVASGKMRKHPMTAHLEEFETPAMGVLRHFFEEADSNPVLARWKDSFFHEYSKLRRSLDEKHHQRREQEASEGGS